MWFWLRHELYDIAVKEYKEGQEKSFPCCEYAKHLHEMPWFNLLIDPTTLVLADKTVLSVSKASKLAPPMGASMDRPTGVKVAKNTRRTKEQSVQINDVNESMRKMTASPNKTAYIMVWMQELLEKWGKLASLWTLKEYYATANKFEKMSLVVTQSEAMPNLLTQNNDVPDDVIEINSDGSDMMRLLIVIL